MREGGEGFKGGEAAVEVMLDSKILLLEMPLLLYPNCTWQVDVQLQGFDSPAPADT